MPSAPQSSSVLSGPPEFPEDVEFWGRLSSAQGYLIEQSIPLRDFLNIATSDSQGVGSLKIAEIEIRQSRSWPFYHEYIVLTVYQRGIKWYIKLERFDFDRLVV